MNRATPPLLAGEWKQHPGRALAAIAAVAIGVAMGYAVQLVNQAAAAEFARSAHALMGDADLEIRGPAAGFDENLYPTVANRPEVAAASPVIEVQARLAGRREVLKIVGVDVFRAAEVHPALVGRPADGGDNLALLHDDALFLSAAAVSWLDVRPGDRVRFQVGLETVELRVAGGLPAVGEAQRVATMDIGAAQWRFDQLGRLQAIDVKLKPGVDGAEFQRRLAPLLPAGVVVATPADNDHRSANLTRAYRLNLDVLALVALFTGAFLVFSSQALGVLRRRGQFALLRILGLTRRQLLNLVLAEGIVLGALGAALGLALGGAVAAATLAWTGGDLGAGIFAGMRPALHFDPLAAAYFFVLGTAAAAGGTLAPALEAARAHPARAIRAGDEEAALGRLRSPVPGLAAIGTGLLLVPLPPIDGLPLAGYGAIALILVGGIALVPWLAGVVFSRAGVRRPVALHLALAQLGGAPGRAAVGLAGILAAFSLIVAMTTMVASFRSSFEQWLDAVLPADLYLRAGTPGDTAALDEHAQGIVQETPGVARAEFLRSTPIVLDRRRPPVWLLARSIDPADPAKRLPLVAGPRRPGPGDPPAVWVSEAMADLYGYKVGQRVTLPIAGKPVDVMVDGVWRDYARQFGAVVIGADDYRRLTGDSAANEAALWLAPGAGAAAVAERIRSRLPNGALVATSTPGEIRATSQRIFDRSFAVTYVLEAVACLIGLAGVAVSASSQALARRREFGMLRHIGLGRAQIGAMLATEGALLSGFGALAGLALGGGVAIILVEVVNPQSFHWTMDMHFPWARLATLAALLVCAAAGTAAWAGRQAMAAGAVHAVRDDW